MKIPYCIRKILYSGNIRKRKKEKTELPSFDPIIDITRILSPNILLLKED